MPQAAGSLGAFHFGGGHVGGMQARTMRGIDRALEHLRPIAGGVNLDDADLRIGRGRPGRRLEFAHGFGRTHVNPDKAAALARRIGFVLHALQHRTVGRLGRHFHHVAVDVEFPAVIEAPQAAFLVAAEGERGVAMRATLGEHAKPALAVAEYDQILAEHARAHRRGIRFRHFFRQAGRQPVAAEQLAHRRVALDAAQQVVFLRGHFARSISLFLVDSIPIRPRQPLWWRR